MLRAFVGGTQISREQIYQACFEVAAGLAQFVTTGRRWLPYSSVSPEQCPALFMSQVREMALEPKSGELRGGPRKIEMFVDFSIYVDSGQDLSVVPTTALNAIIDIFTEVGFPVGASVPTQTLGGLVSEARWSGELKMVEGQLGSRAIAFIGVRIVTASV
jgi:hypothetical protein